MPNIDTNGKQLGCQGSKYTDADRIRAITEYSIRGSFTKASEAMNIPRNTLTQWVKSEWGQDMLLELRQHNHQRFIATSQAIIDKATEVTLDKLDEAGPQQAATIGAIYYDKLRLALALPSSYSSAGSGIDQLVKQFQDISQRFTDGSATVVNMVGDDQIEDDS